MKKNLALLLTSLVGFGSLQAYDSPYANYSYSRPNIPVTSGYYDPASGDFEPAQPKKYNPEASPSRIYWHKNFDEALAQARDQNKRVVILFTGSTWCPACIKLENEVLSKFAFARAVGNNFVFLKAEFNDYSESGMHNSPYRSLMERYGVEAYPTFVVVDSSGKLLYKVNYQPGGPAAYAQALNRSY